MNFSSAHPDFSAVTFQEDADTAMMWEGEQAFFTQTYPVLQTASVIANQGGTNNTIPTVPAAPFAHTSTASSVARIPADDSPLEQAAQEPLRRRRGRPRRSKEDQQEQNQHIQKRRQQLRTAQRKFREKREVQVAEVLARNDRLEAMLESLTSSITSLGEGLAQSNVLTGHRHLHEQLKTTLDPNSLESTQRAITRDSIPVRTRPFTGAGAQFGSSLYDRQPKSESNFSTRTPSHRLQWRTKVLTTLSPTPRYNGARLLQLALQSQTFFDNGECCYTGKLCVQYMVDNMPSKVRWAIAGRNKSKLEEVAAEMQVIEAGVFKACAENGTHYVDGAGEPVWRQDMIDKYEEIAKKSGSKTFSLPTLEVVGALYDIKGLPSGGAVDSISTTFANNSISRLLGAININSISPVKPVGNPNRKDGLPRANIFGVQMIDGMGTMTTNFHEPVDLPLIGRSWGLFASGDNGAAPSYGPNFRFSSRIRMSNALVAWLFRVTYVTLAALIFIPPVRFVVGKLFPPGAGASAEKRRNYHFTYRAMGIADTTHPMKPTALVEFHYPGDANDFTAMTMTEAGLLLLDDQSALSSRGGGILTPASLRDDYIF
ncbi:hypothetical protein MY3296_000452 [Beauveria thailandica]